jgi:hypothetical protein
MSGSGKISDDEKKEMIEDSKNTDRGKVFNAARILCQKGSIDDYIDFLSENMGSIKHHPTRKITKSFKL